MEKEIKYLNNKEFQTKIVEVAELFDGVPISQVSAILKQAKEFLYSAHIVNIKNKRFKTLKKEYLNGFSD